MTVFVLGFRHVFILNASDEAAEGPIVPYSCLHVDSSIFEKTHTGSSVDVVDAWVRHLGRNPEAPTSNRQ